jgi:hypothetical protein
MLLMNRSVQLIAASASSVQIGSHDVTNLIGEDERYPGVNRFN